MIDDSKIDKIRKLANKSPHAGERDAARHILQRWGIGDIDDTRDTDEREVEECQFAYTTKHQRKLLLQIAHMVSGGRKLTIYKKRGGRTLYIECTGSEADQIGILYRLLSPALDAHLNLACRAFIQANDIFPKTEELVRSREMTADAWRVLEMAMVTDIVPRPRQHLQIESGE
jgi:hypothetical protein